MAGKKTGKRLLTWVLVLVMALSLLPLNVLAANRSETDGGSGMIFTKQLVSETPDNAGNYTIQMTAQATGKTTTTSEPVPMDIVLVLDQSGSMAWDFSGNKTNKDENRRQYAMKEAVISFIDEVADKNADHRMAIVTFGDEAATLAGWTAVNGGDKNKLTNAIDNLTMTPSGATNVGDGMQMAKNLMNSSEAGTDRLKTVIVFTDGVPTTASDFDTDVANAAIAAAKSMKGSGVTIYTVGIFNGADPDVLYGKDQIGFMGEKEGECSGEKGDYWQYRKGAFSGGDIQQADIAAGNRFLNYLSSNYDANKIGVSRYEKDHLFAYYIGFEITDNPAKGSNQGYYKTAADASSLEKIFKKISNTVPEPVNSKLDDKTVITDTLSNYFTFAGTADDVKVYAKKSNGDTYLITDGIDVDGKTVKVTGYDFSAHYKGIGNAEETLFIEIKVRPDTSYTNWGTSGEYETNKDDATVTLPNSEVNPIAIAASPKAHVDTYKVTYRPGDGTGNEDTDQYYPNGTTRPVKANEFTAPDGYEFDCWKDEDGNTYQAGGTITFDKSNVILTAQWKQSKYTVTYEYTGTIPTDAPAVPAEAQHDYDAEVTIENVPTLTGYTFHGWTLPGSLTENGGKFKMPAENVTITGYWTPNTDTQYTVEYYYQNADGTYPTTASATATRTGTTGTLASVTEDDKADKEKGKYTYDNSAANVESGTIAADGSLKLKLYFKLSKFDYTIKYYYEGQSTPFDQTPANVTYGTEVLAVADSSKLAPHYSRKSVEPKLPVTIDKAGIVIEVTYAKDPAGDGTFDFNDVFHDGKNTPAITKTVKGNVGKNFKETFKVTVEPKSDNAKNTMTPDYYIGKAEVIASKSLKDVPFLFKPEVVVNASVPYGQLLFKPEVVVNAVVPYGELRFTEAGTYTYTVREQLPDKTSSRMSYDTTEYTLTINVVLDKEANTYKVESWQFTAGNRPYPAPLNIVNTYRTYHPSTPSKPTLNTGDHYAYVMGYPDGTVRPNGSITRAEVSTILFRLLSDKTRDEYFTTESSFTDVKAGAWYNNSIATLEKAGVIVDTAKGGAFRPNEAITRAELAAMLAQFSDAKPVKGVKFSDVSAEHWAYEAIAIAAKMGWIEGYPDGTFRPDATITRAEMMTLVNRALERVPSDEDHLLSKRVMLTFPDCKSGDWFYIAVQEATNSHTYERAATEKNGDEQWTALRANRDWTLLEK